MIMEIIKISAAIVLGSLALSIIVFVLTFISWIISGFIQGAKEGYNEVLKQNNASSFKKLIENKRRNK